MRVSIDKSLCAGHGRCFSTAPKIFGYDEEGFGVPLEDTIPTDLVDEARRAAAGCPERAITVTDG
jgi:ferredoxin